MSDTGASGTFGTPRGRPLALVGALAALAGFAALQLAAFLIAGVFEYPLDDVYIHLAMAEGIVAGGYGVNPGEPASAASSVLYPVLLAAAPGTWVQRLLPLGWNLLAVAVCGALWGRALSRANLAAARGVALAALGPLALNMPGVAFTGMENGLHTALSLAVMFGLWRALQDNRVTWWFVAAAVLSPLFRFEGLALSLLSAGALALTGRSRLALWLAAGVVVPVLAFGGFLMSLGLSPVPGSILARVGFAATGSGAADRVFGQVLRNLAAPPGWLLSALVVLSLVLALGARGRTGLFLLVLAVAGMAHLLVAQIGWMHRHEHYAVVTLLSGIALSSAAMGSRLRAAAPALLFAACVASGAAFLPRLVTSYVWNTRTIHLQQTQMARFAREFFQVSVAVNDLGRVAWSNPSRVLDLWGLGSAEARAVRQASAEPPAGWAAPLAAAQDVRMAMIYDAWFATAAGPDWAPLAKLYLDGPHGPVGDTVVTFYAVGTENVVPMRTALDAFAPTLPAGARLERLPESAP